MVAGHRRQGGHGHGGALQRLDPPDEQEQRSPGGEIECPSRLGPVAGSEEGVVHAGGHDADPRRVGAVELGDLGRLDGAGGEDRVRAPDHGRLGLGPDVPGVRLDLLGAGLGLDPVQRVERRHQGEVELVLDGVPGDAAEPVVGVHGIEGQVVAVADRCPTSTSPSTPRRRTRRPRRSTPPWPWAPADPPAMWCTRNPGSMSMTWGRSSEAARVKTSHTTPVRASAADSSRT